MILVGLLCLALDSQAELRAKLDAGVDFEIQDASVSEACVGLSRVLQAQVFYDRYVILFPAARKVTWKLRKGTALDGALSQGLAPAKLDWILYEGALVITTPGEKALFAPGAAIGGPPDELLLRDAQLAAKLLRPCELKQGMTIDQMLTLFAKDYDLNIDRRYFTVSLEQKLEWTSSRTVLAQLRLLARPRVALFKFKGDQVVFDSDPVGFGKIIDASVLSGTVSNARTAGYQNDVRIYQSLVDVLRKRGDLAKEAVLSRLEGRDDDKGRAVLKKLLEDLDK